VKKRFDIINELIEKYGYDNYLEIGVQTRETFEKVECNYKIGVDPNPYTNPTFVLTSDAFFDQNTKKFDIIFIDGNHEFEQSYKDIDNSLDVLLDGGTIVVHDVNPSDAACGSPKYHGGGWSGEVWKTWLLFRADYDLEMFVIDTDAGIGIMRIGKQLPLLIKSEDLNFENFDKNRKEWLNLVSENEYMDLL